MAGIWCMLSHWRETGYRYFPHQNVVYLHFLFNNGISGGSVHGYGVLVEYKELYFVGQTKPPEIPVTP
jgi:hypothetical protein